MRFRHVLAATLLAVAACADNATRPLRDITLSEPSRVLVGAGWTIAIDGSQPNYTGPSPFSSSVTAWVTVKDNTGATRWDSDYHNWISGCTSGMSCSIVNRNLPGGTQWGVAITVDPNVEGTLNLDMLRSDLTHATAQGIYRGIGVWSIHGPFASSYAFAPLQTAQFVDTAFSRWNQNVSPIFPASYSISNSAVGNVSSSGFFTSTDCGTANVTVSRGAQTASHSVSVSPCRPHITISGPSVVRPNAMCTYTATVTGGSGSYTSMHWYSDGAGLGDGSSVTINTSSLDGFINILVTDANGTNNSGSFAVTLDSNASNCT